MAHEVCAETVTDIAVRYGLVRYGRCDLCRNLKDVAVRYKVVRYGRCGVCKNCNGHGVQI
jgi:hypothetical protein